MLLNNMYVQAINLAEDVLSNTKLVEEKKHLQLFFSEIAQSSGKYAFGIHDTMQVTSK
jgi:peptide subunit release factor 1 (eRF1)